MKKGISNHMLKNMNDILHILSPLEEGGINEKDNLSEI